MLHRLYDMLRRGEVRSTQEAYNTPEGYIFGWGTTVGNGVEGWAPGAFYVHSDGAAGAMLYRNTGTKTTATWTVYSTLKANAILGDDLGVVLGDGSDAQLLWNASYLELAPASGFWANCPIANFADPSLSYELYEDFLELSIGDATSRWTLDSTSGTAVLGAAETVGLGGVLVLEASAGLAENFANLKVTSTDTGCAFKITKDSGKNLWAEFRVKVATNLADASCYIGLLGEAETEPGTDDTGAENLSDGVYFRVLNDASTELDFCVNKNTTETEVKANITTLNTTWLTLGLYFDGVNTITPYINGVAGTDTVAADATNFPHDEGLTPDLFVKTGDAGAETLWVDWVKVVQLR